AARLQQLYAAATVELSGGTGCDNHGRFRVADKPTLKESGNRITDSHEPRPRLRKRCDVVPNGTVRMKLDGETFLTKLNMRRQRPKGKSETANWLVLVNRVDDAGRIQPPHAPYARCHSNGLTSDDWCIGWENARPGIGKLPPLP